MAKKSPRQEKTLRSGEQPVKAANATKAPKPFKQSKPAKAAKAATSAFSVAIDIVAASHNGKPVKSPRKKKEAPFATPASATAAASNNNLVAVMEKPQPLPEVCFVAASVEGAEYPARSESANADDAGALYILGIRYSTGRDVEQDLIAAHKWFNLAAMLGHEDAKPCRADVASEMSKAQIAEAQRQARDWMRARDAKHSREAEQPHSPELAQRPTYVRRRAQAVRSANSFARTCACA